MNASIVCAQRLIVVSNACLVIYTFHANGFPDLHKVLSGDFDLL